MRRDFESAEVLLDQSQQGDAVEPVVDTSQITELSLHEAMYGTEKRSAWSISPLFVFIGILLLASLGAMQTLLPARTGSGSSFPAAGHDAVPYPALRRSLFASTRQIVAGAQRFTHPSSNNALMINGAFVNQAGFSQSYRHAGFIV